MKTEENYVDGKYEGKQVSYYENGKVKIESSYVNGKEEGKEAWYYESGKVKIKENYVNGKKEGKWVRYYESGKVKEERDYIDEKNLWEADFTFRGSRSRGLDPNDNSFLWEDNYWMDSNFDFNITKNWVASYSMRFDMKNNEITSHNFIIHRPLHCWVFNFRWYPGVGPDNYGSGFQLLIKVKNPDLQDIRLKHTKGNMFGF